MNERKRPGILLKKKREKGERKKPKWPRKSFWFVWIDTPD